MDIRAKRRQNIVRALHHCAAYYDSLGVIRVDKGDDAGGPNPQTSFADKYRNWIASAAAMKQSLKVDAWLSRQCGFRIAGPRCANRRECPGRSFRFYTTDVSTNARPPVPHDWQMASQTSTLKML